MKPSIFHQATLSVAAASVALLGCTAAFGSATTTQTPGQNAQPVHSLGNNGAATNGTGSGANPAPAATGGIGAANNNNGADLHGNANASGAAITAGGSANPHNQGTGNGTGGPRASSHSVRNQLPATAGGIGANNDNNGADLRTNSNGVRTIRGGHGRQPMTNQTRLHRVQKLLAHFVNETVETNGLRDSAKSLTKADRHTLRPGLKNVKAKALNGRIREFRKDWKAKYGKEFKITKPETVFSNIQVSQRKVTSGSLLVTLPAPSAMSSHMGNNSSMRRTRTMHTRHGNGLGASARTMRHHLRTAARSTRHHMRMAGRSAISAMSGRSAHSLRLHVLREHKHTYRLQLPSTITASRYRKDVQYVLTKVDQNRSQWPGNATSAYRLVSYKLFSRLFKPSGSQVSDAQMRH